LWQSRRLPFVFSGVGAARDNARECIYMTLPSGLCSADRVARHLGVDRRTLHRHLAREGETFSSLLDVVRAELAVRYIGTRSCSASRL
jgi:AraC-like DNA-binding protein